jgi:predicted HTH transcriptional regulator
MIDLTKVQLCANTYVDGVLDDGRFVEFKVKIPNNLDKLVRLIVAMANSNGGLIIFGVDERTMSVIGILGNCESHKQKIATEIKRLSIGVTYTLIT